MELKIVSPNGVGLKTEVYLDGKKLTGVIDLKIEIDLESPNRATITFWPSKLEIDGEFTVERKSTVLPKEVPHA